MDKITRQSLLDLLNGDWANYVSRFQGLSPAARAVFLEKQGYKRLADLLAHIAAWWEVGLENIGTYRRDPAFRQPEIEVDDFNASAVQRVRARSDFDEIKTFEAARLNFIKVVKGLSEADFQDERVLDQIRMELVNHLEEHRIP